MTCSRFRRVIDAALFAAVVLALAIAALLSAYSSAYASLNNGEPAIDILGEFSSVSSDTTAVYTKGCPNNGASQIGFDSNAGSAIDPVNHWLFVPEQYNNRVVVFPLTSGNLISSKTASYVLGQTNFTNCTANEGSNTPSQSSLNMGAGSLCVDSTNQRLFVPDWGNNRVMVFSTSSMSNGENASYELGQPSGGTAFTTYAAAMTQPGLHGPQACAYDSTNQRLYVADNGNNRVMVFSTSSLANGENASYVLGQSGYGAGGAATTQAGLSGPTGLSLDSADSLLYVSDGGNNRILAYNTASLATGMNASTVFGQSSYSGGSANEGGSTSQTGLNAPGSLAYDSTNYRLFAADVSNNRALAFNTANVTNDENAPDILGQFTSASSDVTADYVKSCPNNGASPIGFNLTTASADGTVLDTVHNWMYISDTGNNRVLVFPLNATTHLLSSKTASYVLGQSGFTTCAANQGSSTPTQSGLSGPQALAIDTTNQRLYVADENNSRVLVFSTSSLSNGMNAANVLGETTFTSTAGGNCNTIYLPAADGVAFDATNNRLFAAASVCNAVYVYNLSGGLTNGMAPTNYLGSPSFHLTSPTQSILGGPAGLFYDSANSVLYEADEANSRVMVFSVPCTGPCTTNGFSNTENASYEFGQPSGTAFTSNAGVNTQSGLSSPLGVALDSANNRLFVADGNNNRVMIFPTASTGGPAGGTNGENATYEIGNPNFTTNNGSCNVTSQSIPCGEATSVTYDSTNDLLYMTDSTGNRVMIFNVGTTGLTPSFTTQGGPDACAIAAGALYCWGGNFQGEDGTGNTTASITPQQVGSATNWTVVSQGDASAFDADACGIAGGNLYCWGDNADGENGNGTSTENNSPVQVTSPSTTWSTVSQSGVDACAVTTGNALYCWGKNYYGEDGIGNTTASTTPQQITSPSLNWSTVSQSGNDACGITTGNALYCWGYNQYGEDGVGTTVENNSPVQVGVPTTPNWGGPVSQGGGDACAIHGGALYCWGWNGYGEDGVGNTTAYNAPQQVGTDTTWTAISQSDLNFDEAGCGIDNGKLYCWGRNSFGELGLGNTTAYHTPQQVGSDTTWTAISTSGEDTCGIDNGKLYCWGINTYGEVGQGNTTQYTTPQQVGSATNWIAVSTGGYDTCGIRGSSGTGSLYCWGEDKYGEAGAAATVFVTSTTYAANFGGTASAALTAANGDCQTASTTGGTEAPTGTYLAWLGNSAGPSTNFTTRSVIPYAEVNGTVVALSFSSMTTNGTLINGISLSSTGGTVSGSTWTNVAVGGAPSTNTTSTTKNCSFWTINSASPSKGDDGTIGSAAAAWTAGAATVACSSSESLYCFQQSGGSALTTPQQVGSATNWSTVSQGGYDTCGIAGGELYCWGYNHQDELGLGNTTDFASPQAVGTSISTTGWTAVSIQYDGTADGDACGVVSGALYCWGHNADGEVGVGGTTAHTTPVQVGVATNWSTVSYGGNDTCAVNSSNVLYCWGHNNNGEDGVGNSTENKSPVQVPSIPNYSATWIAVSQGQFDTCAIQGSGMSGALYCWGRNNHGELGLGNSTKYTSPQQVGSATNWSAISIQNSGGTQLATAAADACGIAGGALYCWGQNTYGEDGLGNTTANNTPQRVGSDTTWTAVSFGNFDTCGIDNSQLYCWGYNHWGEDGVGTTTENNSPVEVNGLGDLSNGEDAEDLLGQYSSPSSTTTVEWTSSGANNGPTALSVTPQGVVLDTVHHQLFVSDDWNNRVLVYTLTTGNAFPSGSGGHTASYVIGAPSLQGNSDTNSDAQNQLASPKGLAIDTVNNRLFVAESQNYRVTVYNTPITSNGPNAVHVLGAPGYGWFGEPACTQSGMVNPSDVAYDSVNNNLYVADVTCNRVLVFNVAPGTIADGENASYEFGQTAGSSQFTSSTVATTQSGMSDPSSLSYDSVNQRLFVSDQYNNRVLVFSTSSLSNGPNATNVIGQASFTAALTAQSQTGLYDPSGVTYDPVDGWLFVANCEGVNILEYNAAPGALPTYSASANFVLGSATFAGTAFGTTQATMDLCQGSGQASPMAYDPSTARLFVSDLYNSRVMIFSANTPGNPVNNEAASYVLGQTDFFSDIDADNQVGQDAGDGPVTQSGMNYPYGVAFDSTNDLLYVDDSGNNRLMQFNVAPGTLANGENASDLLGHYNSTTSTATVLWNSESPNNGPTALGFYGMAGMALDPLHHWLFVTDQYNNRVLVYALNTDNSFPSGSGGHTATYVLGQTSLQGGDVCTTTQSSLCFPNDLAVDPVNQLLYVGDTGNDRVMVFSTASMSNGENASYEFGQPSGVNAFTTNGGCNVTYQACMSWGIFGLALDVANQRLFVADNSLNRVMVFNVAPGTIANGELASNLLGCSSWSGCSYTPTQSAMNDPAGVAYDSVNQRLFVADYIDNRVMVFSVPPGFSNGENASYELGQPSGVNAFTTSGGADTRSGMAGPTNLAYDANNSRLFVNDTNNNRVLTFNVGPSVIQNGENAAYVLGQASFTTNSAGTTQSTLFGASEGTNPYGGFAGLVYDPGSGRLFVSDIFNYRVMIFEGSAVSTPTQSGFIPGYE